MEERSEKYDDTAVVKAAFWPLRDVGKGAEVEEVVLDRRFIAVPAE